MTMCPSNVYKQLGCYLCVAVFDFWFQIVRQLWAYIRKNNLQDPSNKRKIICDDALRVVFETDCTDMFKMNKLLAKHILPLDPSSNGSLQTCLLNSKCSWLVQ